MTNEYINLALQAGLSPKAASVYVCLLQSGSPLSPKSLVLQTQLHRQYVYDALRELQDRGLILASGEGKRVRYRSLSPDTLLRDAEKRRLDALEGVRGLMRLYDRSPAGIVEIVRGSEAVVQDEFKEMEKAAANSSIEIIGGAGMSFIELFAERVSEWEELRKNKNIKLRYLGGEEDVRHNRRSSAIENESRMLPGVGRIVNVVIRPDSVSFNIYNPEVLTVRVRNEEMVHSQRAVFEALWRIAI